MKEKIENAVITLWKHLHSGEDGKDHICSYISSIGPSWEHWIQFEFGYQLHRSSGDNFSIWLETETNIFKNAPKHPFDVVIYEGEDLTRPVDRKSPPYPFAIIEIKTMGNWTSVMNQISEVQKDIKLLEMFKKESVVRNIQMFVLVFSTFALPKEGQVRWMEGQLKGYKDVYGRKGRQSYEEPYKEYIKKITDELHPIRYPSSTIISRRFDQLSLDAFLKEVV